MRYFLALLTLAPFLLISQNYKSIVNSNNSFGFDAYYELSNDPDYLISPFSVSSALSMTYVGAIGSTKKQMKEVFHFPTDSILNSGYSELTRILRQPFVNTDLSIANKLWVDKNRVSLSPEFVDTNKKYYSGAIKETDFGNAFESTFDINTWVANKTNSRIQNIISPDVITPDVILIVTNAVYFKSNWKTQFDPRYTHPGTFTNHLNQNINVSYMISSGYFSSFQNELVSILELPYVGDDFSFLILLPKLGMKQLEFNLSSEILDSWLSEIHREKFTLIQIPKFKSSFKTDLRQMLRNLGMPNAFDAQAEFGGIGSSGGRIIISKVLHKTFIEVNEEGTEAAAATAVVAVARSMPTPKEFVVDRPFMYAIKHNKTNTILFLGKSSNPTY
ncbi:MAG: serpin family protein [Cytophagales bacterium]|nr:serpin family protein [Cytophagales bacterium]